MTNNQRKEPFAEVVQRVKKDEFIDKLISCSREATIEYFNLGLTNFAKLVDLYECKDILAEEAKRKRKETHALKAKQKLDTLCLKAPKELFIDFYISQNNSYQQVAEHFKITEGECLQLITYYDCKKPKTLSTKISSETKLEKYGSATYNNRDQAAETCIKKYGVDNPAKVSSVVESIKDTKFDKYGDASFNNWTKGHETRIDNFGTLEESYRITYEHVKATMLSEYGVDNPAKLDFVKDKIRKSTEQTFMEKYGAACYWLTNNAKRSNGSKDSSYNIGFAKLLEEHNIPFDREFVVGRFIYDFKVGNYLVEVDPTPTHNVTCSPYSEQGLDKNYHKNKSLNAANNGYRCIHIWDWDNPDAIIEQLLLPKIRIYARECIIKEVSLEDAKEFITKHHLQGYARDSIRLGLYYKDTLVSIMTFGKPRYSSTAEYELIRYCAKYTIIGGPEKLFKSFVKNYNPESIVSYCDKSKFKGDVYTKLRFKYKGTSLSHHWYNMKTKKHILDSLLRQRGFDQLFGTDYGKGTSNTALMIQHGFVELVDAGQDTYMWTNSSIN